MKVMIKHGDGPVLPGDSKFIGLYGQVIGMPVKKRKNINNKKMTTRIIGCSKRNKQHNLPTD